MIGFKSNICILKRIFMFVIAFSCFFNVFFENNSSTLNAAETEFLAIKNAPDMVFDVIEDKLLAGATPDMDAQDDLYSITLNNHDGTKSRYAFASPIKYKENNIIKYKSDKIKKENKLFSSYAFKNGDNTINTYFPKKIKSGILLEHEQYNIVFSPVTNKNTKAEMKTVVFHDICEEMVVYRDVFGNGTELQYRPLIDGIKENIVLEQYTGQNVFQFHIEFGELIPATLESEMIPLLDPITREPVVILGQPDARDSFTGENVNNECHYTLSNSLRLFQDKKGWKLEVIIDKAFLESPTTVYPVTIDPTVTIDSTSAMEDTTIYSASNANYCTYLNLVVGYTDARYGEGRILNKYTQISSFKDVLPENIINATYTMFEISDYTYESTIRVHEINQIWDQMKVNWSNCPPIGDFVCDKIVKRSGEVQFPMRDLFKKWLRTYRDSKVDTGCSFILIGWNPSGSIPQQRIFGSSHWMVQKRPYFHVHYADSDSFENGVYYIKNQQSGKYLDLYQQGTVSGTNVHQWEFHGGFSQQWKVRKNSDGYYTVQPMSAPSCLLDVNGNYNANGSNIQISNKNNEQHSVQWQITYNRYGDSTYRMMNRASGNSKAMVVQYASSENGANVIQYDYSNLGNRNDDWVLERAEITLPTPIVKQPDGSTWCWAACSVMAAQTHYPNSSKTMEDVVKYIKGTNDTNAEGGSLLEIERAVEYLTNNKVDYYAAAGVYTEDILTRLLRNGNPVIMGCYQVDASGNSIEKTEHAIIIYGFFYRTSDYTARFLVKDPWGSDTERSYDELLRFANFRWFGVAVRNVYKANETVAKPV